MIFNKIKQAKGSNEKLRIAKEEFTSKEHEFMEVCFNDTVYGISGKGIAKAIGYDEEKHGKFEDLAEFIEKTKYITEHNGIKMSIKEFVDVITDFSGNEQIEQFRLNLNLFDSNDVPWVIRAIQKNMRIGLNLTSYNKVRKHHGLPELKGFGVQLCGKLDVSKENFEKLSYPRIAEYKYDGERCIITVLDGKVSLQSRAGKDITEHYPEVVKLLESKFKGIKSLKLDSEIISSSFVKLSTRMHRKAENIEEQDDSLKTIIFDILLCDGKSLKDKMQVERRTFLELLAKRLDLELSYLTIVKDVDELLKFYKDARHIEQEGVVTKDLDMKWTEGSRDGWTKMVPKESLDLQIVDAYYGNGKNSKFISGVIVENKDKTIKAKAASGITDEYREILTNLHDENKLIGMIAEISYREISKSKNEIDSLRFPVFRRLREDKNEPD